MSTPTSAVIVALPADDDPVHQLADDAHVTLLFLGEATNLTPDEVADVDGLLKLTAENLASFDVGVSGSGVLGEDQQPVLLVQSEALTYLRDLLAAEPAVTPVTDRVEQFPSWVPHLSVRDQQRAASVDLDGFTVGALGLWLGGQHRTYELLPPTWTRLPDHLADEEETAETLAVSGYSCPAVTDERSLYVALRHAEGHPAARPYVIKRASALRLTHLVPTWPELESTVVHLDRRRLALTAAGGFTDRDTGERYRPTPPSRRQRRAQAAERPITDAADLLAAVNRKPTNPARRRALIEAARRLDRLPYIPADWAERSPGAASLAPGAADAIHRAAYGVTSAEAAQVQHGRVRGAR
ncbi:2'-5' RNA ligase family protein [uncultured Modestobacter sp.]|uniref:2'-5' RNA ligase family protein n=1 Tax=uncultured Modestobacter sp. TaxID=380048 RepID=UPI0026072FDB|nr:2'-5' RNA ligase family protein [uncultured Modestobacter sp.]